MGKLVFEIAEGTIVQNMDSTPSVEFDAFTAANIAGKIKTVKDPLYRNVIDSLGTIKTSIITVKDTDTNKLSSACWINSNDWTNKRLYNIFNRDTNGYSYMSIYYRIVSDDIIEFLLVYYSEDDHSIRYRIAQVNSAGKSTNKTVTTEYISSFVWIRLAHPSDKSMHTFSDLGVILIGDEQKALIKYDKLNNDHYGIGLSIENTNDSPMFTGSYSSADEDSIVVQPISYNQYVSQEIITEAVNTINNKIGDVVNDFQQTFVSR